jgi:hypothetical protein
LKKIGDLTRGTKIFILTMILFQSVTAPKVWDIGAGTNMAFRKVLLKALITLMID